MENHPTRKRAPNTAAEIPAASPMVAKSTPKTKKEEVISFLEGRSTKVPAEAPGGLLMYIYYRRDKSAGFAQINDFDQYQYKPITDLLSLGAAQVKALV